MSKRIVTGNSRSGLSLVEAIIAIMVFAISVAGICKLVLLARQSADRARSHYTAVNLSKNRLERARTFAYAMLPQFLEDRVVVNSDGNPDPNGEFRRTTVIANLSPMLCEMVVTVEIRNKVSLAFSGQSEVLRTYYADFQSKP